MLTQIDASMKTEESASLDINECIHESENEEIKLAYPRELRIAALSHPQHQQYRL